MKSFILLFLGWACPIALAAQSLTLDACKLLAHAHYPAIKQYQLLAQTRDFTMDNAAKAWLPQVSVQVTGLVFTDILKSNIPAKQLGVDMKQQLAAGNVMVRQQLYDGGKTAAQRQSIAAEAMVQTRQLDVTLHELNHRIEQLFFGILIHDTQIHQLRLVQEDLDLSRKTVASLQQGGMANQSDLDAVAVEQVKACQSMEAVRASREAYLQMLGLFVGKDLHADSLVCPDMVVAAAENRHPQLTYYQAQLNGLSAERKLLDARLLPTLSAFGLGLYHTQLTDMARPGMLAAGLSFSWNIGALYTRKNDLRNLELKRRKIENQRETFLFDNRLKDEQTNGNIASLRRQLTLDEQLVALRQRLRTASEKKVRFGTESVNELLRQVNALNEARLQQALHQIQLLSEIHSLKTNRGQ